MKQILWFRRDLRATDHKLLTTTAHEVLPIFIFDPQLLDSLPKNDHRVTFIFEHVLHLKRSLCERGLNLAVFHGKPIEVFQYLARFDIQSIQASPDYDSYARNRDQQAGEIIPLQHLNDNYLINPDDHLKNDGTPYKVFTPFYKKLLERWNESCETEYASTSPELFPFDYEGIIRIDPQGVLFKDPLEPSSISFQESSPGKEWAKQTPKQLFEDFQIKLNNYAEKRDCLDENLTSKMSVHLRFGTISVRQLVRTLQKWKQEGFQTEPFFRQLIWREFFAYILYHFPHSEQENFQPINVEWENDEKKFDLWKQGQTGVPIIDAAMRELNTTGYMHNRARMITASFLTKDLHIDWRWGERYFAEKLFDYDAASNIGSWQWAASTGTDAQPYFRVFNPYLQAKKFDPEGVYIKRYVQELKDAPASFLHQESKLQQYGLPGYPPPIITHKTEAQRSIERFKKPMQPCANAAFR